MQTQLWRASLAGAGITIGSLFGGTLFGFVVGSVVFDVLPGHSIVSPNPLHILFAALPALVGFVGGSALWGIWMARLAQASNRKRMALAGILGFAPITILLALALEALEPIAVETLGAQFPIHRIFTLLFVPTAFLVAGVSAWALGRGLQNPLLARRLFLDVGCAAALCFLAVNLLMEAFGWQVGAPGAAERVTMLTVLFAGDLAAAIGGGAVIGVLITQPNAMLVRAQSAHL